MHVGANEQDCPCLFVRDQEMIKVDCDKYLGDYLSVEGKNDRNINEKWNKGIGFVSQVIGLLKEISLGQYYFDIALLLRNTNILNGILFNYEVLYGLTKTQIEKNQKCRRDLPSQNTFFSLEGTN